MLRTAFSVSSAALLLATLPAISPAHAKPCMRLALSEVAFGTENATRDARNQLDEYAAEQVKKREWPKGAKLAKSAEKVSCEVFLTLPIGTEYRCLVTATFCVKK